jgi:hypothetical protein
LFTILYNAVLKIYFLFALNISAYIRQLTINPSLLFLSMGVQPFLGYII